MVSFIKNICSCLKKRNSRILYVKESYNFEKSKIDINSKTFQSIEYDDHLRQ